MDQDNAYRFSHAWLAPGTDVIQKDIRLTVQDGFISAVAAADTADEPAERVTGLAMPGFINAHDHGYGTPPLGFGCYDESLECWIAALAGRVPVDPELEAMVAFGRMALAGIAATVHCHNSLRADALPQEAAAVSRAADTVGIRVAFSCPILDRNRWVYGGPEALAPLLPPADREAFLADAPALLTSAEQITQVEAIAADLHREKFQIQYGPIGPQWCEDDTLAAIADASETHQRRVHMHLLESPRQRQWLDTHYPDGIVTHLDRIGLLSPRLTVAHGVWLTEAECALLAERGVTVAVNTASNLRLRSGIAPVPRFIENDVPFGFGLDGGAIDDNQDYAKDLRLAWRLHDGVEVDSGFPVDRLFQAAYRDARPAIDGLAGYGRLQAGAPADLAVFDLARMTEDVISPSPDLGALLLGRMAREYVTDLFVGGRRVVRGGQVESFSFRDAELELHAQSKKLAHAADPAEAATLRNRQEAVRRYYRGNWLAKP